MKIVIAGFGPFGGETVNPAFEAVQRLPDRLDGASLVRLELPVVFGRATEVLEEAIVQGQPDAVLCIGQAGGRSAISVEKTAINYRDARIADNAGFQPVDTCIYEDGDTAYFATVPVRGMVQAMRDAGIPAYVSYSAGTYVCNDIMYSLLYLIDRKYPGIQGGFIHVPFLQLQALSRPAGTPFMHINQIVLGLQAGLQAVISQVQDGKESLGSLY